VEPERDEHVQRHPRVAGVRLVERLVQDDRAVAGHVLVRLRQLIPQRRRQAEHDQFLLLPAGQRRPGVVRRLCDARLVDLLRQERDVQARVQALVPPHAIDVLAGSEPAHELREDPERRLRLLQIRLLPAAGGDRLTVSDRRSLGLIRRYRPTSNFDRPSDSFTRSTRSSISRNDPRMSLSSSPIRSRDRSCSIVRNRVSCSGRPCASIPSRIAR
jgi:hypothetical protein